MVSTGCCGCTTRSNQTSQHLHLSHNHPHLLRPMIFEQANDQPTSWVRSRPLWELPFWEMLVCLKKVALWGPWGKLSRQIWTYYDPPTKVKTLDRWIVKPHCQHIDGESIQENSWHNSSTVDAAEVLKLAANPRLRRRSKIATMSHFCDSRLSHEDEVGVAAYCALAKLFLIILESWCSGWLGNKSSLVHAGP